MGNFPNKLSISFDVDWAPDEIMEPITELLRNKQISATFFATHQSDLLQGLEDELFEIAIHPNFSGCNGDYEKPIKELLAMYPQAKGARSHLLYNSSPIHALFSKHNLSYESNYHLFMCDYIQAFDRVESLRTIPFYWQDDTHFRIVKDKFQFPFESLQNPGLKVFAFHPIHVHMNTDSEEHYELYREHYQVPQKLEDHINTDRGVGTIFHELLDHISENNIPTFKTIELI